MDWTPARLSTGSRWYGVRSRVRRFRWEVGDARPLLRWFPAAWFTDPLALIDICSPWEVAWVTRHIAKDFTGTGAIVELGPWLGDITLGMIRGLKHLRHSQARGIDVYDLFVFDDIEERTAGLPFDGELNNGDDFLSLFLHRLGGDASVVRPHKGDVLDQTWPPDQPIEFLFNDVAKTWQIWNHVRASFYRGLRPGSTLVEQDWAHTCTPWIHLWHHRHRTCLEPIEQIPHAGSVAFRLVRPLSGEAFEADSFSDYTRAEVGEAFDWAASLVDTRRQGNIGGAHVHLYTLFGDLDTAGRTFIHEVAKPQVLELMRAQVDLELISVALPALSERLELERRDLHRP